MPIILDNPFLFYLGGFVFWGVVGTILWNKYLRLKNGEKKEVDEDIELLKKNNTELEEHYNNGASV